MTCIFRGLTASALVLTSAFTAFAQDSGPTLNDISTGADTKAIFDKMAGEKEIPAWVKGGATTFPTHEVTFGGKTYSVYTGCEKDNCGDNVFAVAYNADDKVMYGLAVSATEESDDEVLTWYNIGGGPESIDGKTVLYAATTGSLENHPDAFNYPQK